MYLQVLHVVSITAPSDLHRYWIWTFSLDDFFTFDVWIIWPQKHVSTSFISVLDDLKSVAVNWLFAFIWTWFSLRQQFMTQSWRLLTDSVWLAPYVLLRPSCSGFLCARAGRSHTHIQQQVPPLVFAHRDSSDFLVLTLVHCSWSQSSIHCPTFSHLAWSFLGSRGAESKLISDGAFSNSCFWTVGRTADTEILGTGAIVETESVRFPVTSMD